MQLLLSALPTHNDENTVEFLTKWGKRTIVRILNAINAWLKLFCWAIHGCYYFFPSTTITISPLTGLAEK